MRGTAWVASYVALWVAVLVLSLAVAALLRQIGVLHTRLRPMGVHFAGEGPERLAPAPMPERFGYGAHGLTLVAFTSPTCSICLELIPALQRLERQYDGDVRLEVVEHGPSTLDVFGSFNVSSTPYLVAVDKRGLVQGRGVANSLEQAEVLVGESLAGAAAPARGGSDG